MCPVCWNIITQIVKHKYKYLYFCFYTLLCARLLKVIGGPKRRIF